MDWATLKDLFTAMAVPSALGIAWLLSRRDRLRREAKEDADRQARDRLAAEAHAHEIRISAQNVVVAEKSTDARMHEIALAAAETASETWKEIVEDLRDHQFPMMRALLAECERRDAANRERIDCLEAAMRASGMRLP